MTTPSPSTRKLAWVLAGVFFVLALVLTNLVLAFPDDGVVHDLFALNAGTAALLCFCCVGWATFPG